MVEVKAPILPDINWQLHFEDYQYMSGIKGTVEAPLINGKVTVDILNETFAMTVGGPLKPCWKLMVCGKEIFNIPRGFAALLGKDIVKAILDLIS